MSCVEISTLTLGLYSTLIWAYVLQNKTRPMELQILFFDSSRTLPFLIFKQLSTICHLFLHACYRSLLSRARQQPTRALANQNATSHLRQLGRLSVRQAHAAKCYF